jgi:hypothetical protein
MHRLDARRQGSGIQRELLRPCWPRSLLQSRAAGETFTRPPLFFRAFTSELPRGHAVPGTAGALAGPHSQPPQSRVFGASLPSAAGARHLFAWALVRLLRGSCGIGWLSIRSEKRPNEQ